MLEKVTKDIDAVLIAAPNHVHAVACKGGPPASSDFDYRAHLTELVLLGTVALRTGETIHWDGPNMQTINSPKAEPLIHGNFRKGWEI